MRSREADLRRVTLEHRRLEADRKRLLTNTETLINQTTDYQVLCGDVQYM